MPPIRGRKTDPSQAAGTRPNTVGLPNRELGELMDQLDARGRGRRAPVERTFSRWPFRRTSLTLVLEQPGGSRTSIRAACRNLSRGGAGLLHGAFTHPGTSCTLHLPRLDGSMAEVKGSIVRCTHLRGLIHELGVKFDAQVNLSTFVEFDPLMGWTSFERVDPRDLTGSVVALVPSDADRRIISHFLRSTGLKIQFADDADEAAGMVEAGCEAVLIELGSPHAETLHEFLRRQPVPTPVIAIAEDAGVEMQRRIQEMDVENVVIKPLRNDAMVNVLAECLLGGGGDAAPSDGAGISGAAMHNCVEMLRSMAKDLHRAMQTKDAIQSYQCCQRMRAVAARVSLRSVVDGAEAASAKLAATMSTAATVAELESLCQACERLQARDRAA